MHITTLPRSHALSKLEYNPKTDLFVSRLNDHFPRCLAYGPDPGAWAADVFTIAGLVCTKILRLLAFLYICSSTDDENQGGQSQRHMYPSARANTGLVSKDAWKKNGSQQKRCISTKPIPATSTNPSRPDPPSPQVPLSPRLPLVVQVHRFVTHRRA